MMDQTASVRPALYLHMPLMLTRNAVPNIHVQQTHNSITCFIGMRKLMQRTAVAPSQLCIGTVILDAVQLVMS